MSTFWSGTLSSLLGAVVGGLFTGIAAWLQARVAAKNAVEQVVLAHQKQLEMLHHQISYQATSQTTKAIWAVYSAADVAIHSHEECGQYIEGDLLALRKATHELESSDNLHTAHLPSVIQEPVAKLLDLCSYSDVGWRDLHKRRSQSGDLCCAYVCTLEEVTQLCMNLIWWFKEARVHILKGNLDAPILNEDPFIWLFHAAPPVNYAEAVRWRTEEIDRDRSNRLRRAQKRKRTAFANSTAAK